MAIVSGVVCVAAGFARLGFVTELLSKPIRYGYMNGIALTVFLSQLPKLFGFSVQAKGPLRQILVFASGVLAGKTNVAAFVVGASTLAAILLLQRRRRIPAILVAVVAATLAVDVFDLATRAGVSVLGALPQGLPVPMLPLIGIDDVTAVLIGGLAVALVSFADTSVLSRAYAARMRTPVDPNRQARRIALLDGFVKPINRVSGCETSAISLRSLVISAVTDATDTNGR